MTHFVIFVNTGAYGTGNFKTLLIRPELKFMMNKAVIREYKVIHLLVICQKLKMLWHFEILTWESMGKIVKCAISRKRMVAEQNG